MRGIRAFLGRVVNTKVIGKVSGSVSVQDIALSTWRVGDIGASGPDITILEVRSLLSDVCLDVFDGCRLNSSRSMTTSLRGLAIRAFLGRKVSLYGVIMLGRGEALWRSLRCWGQAIGMALIIDAALFEFLSTFC